MKGNLPCLLLILLVTIVSCDGNLLSVPRGVRSEVSVCDAPTFSPPPGTYGSDQAVSISCSTSGAAVTCTVSTDGSEPPDPTELSTPCTAPIEVTGNGATAWIKAIATKTGFAPSAVTSGAYTIAYSGSIVVTLTPPSAQPITFTGGSASLSKGTSVTVATSFSASSYAWYLDASSIPVSNGASCVIASSGLGYGLHTLVLIVVNGGVTYSGSMSFVVTQ